MKKILKENKIVAVIRAKSKERAKDIISAVVDGGINCIEATYSIPNVLSLIPELKKMDKNIAIGMGSVLDKKMTLDAIDVGAGYIVSPGYVQEVSDICKEKGILYVPGCMTITEMLVAMKNGNDMIKLFPAEIFGEKMIKSVKAPIPQIEIMPTGGVDVNNIKKWLEAGAVCVGVGGCLTAFESTKDITKMTKLFMEKIYEFKKGI